MLNTRRIIIIFGITLVGFLALYTWDARTGNLSRIFGISGLEIAGQVLRPGIWVKDKVKETWNDYLMLVDVRSENVKLKDELERTQQILEITREDLQELERLRSLLTVPATPAWEQVGARVISAKFGPLAALESVMIDKGFSSGAFPGAPVVVRRGLVGKIYRASPNYATVLLLTDPSLRVSVVSQNSRVRGILVGGGSRQPLELRYVAPNTNMQKGEILISSGIDGVVPGGIPVARVSSVVYDKDLFFPMITAEPLVDIESIEEVLLLVPPKGAKVEELLHDPFSERDPHQTDGGDNIPAPASSLKTGSQ